MDQLISEVISNGVNFNHNYTYALNDYPINYKLEKMVEKHFAEAMVFAKSFGYKKNKETIHSVHHVFRLQIKNAKNLISYDILHDLKKGEKSTGAYTIMFNDETFEYNNIKDAYRQYKKLVETNTSIETDQSSGNNIVTPKDSSNKYQVFTSQYNALKDRAKTNGFTIERHTTKELTLYFKNIETKDSIVFEIGLNADTYTIIYSQYQQQQVTKTFTKIFQAHKYVSELLTSKKVKGDKTVKEPLVKDVKDEIKDVDRFDKLFDTIVAYKQSNDTGYTRLINFLTGELYKNKEIKSIIDLDYNGDTAQIKNIINNHFTKK